jgi:predicted GNAT superfamily acetyltransferase
MTANITLRDARIDDFAAILRLNLDSESVLSPLAEECLHGLHQQAWYHRVACLTGQVEAFLLALAPRASYDSPNYRWFDSRYADFVYIDRIVVSRSARHARLGTALYEDLRQRARAAGVARLTCEFDLDPPNEASRRFHERFGFEQIGAQTIRNGEKRVSMQALRLRP